MQFPKSIPIKQLPLLARRTKSSNLKEMSLAMGRRTVQSTTGNRPATLALWVGLSLLPSAVFAQIIDLGPIDFRGDVAEDEDLSGAAAFGQRLMIGSDEGSAVQVLEADRPDSYRVQSTIPLYGDPEIEADIEAITIENLRVYVAGSHGLVRKKVEYPSDPDDRRYERNRERLTEVEHQDARNRLFRFSIAADGRRTTPIDVINLRTVLASDAVIGRFLAIPGKEGGVDIEGMAADGDSLYVGFRGPVLRQNFVPVVKLNFDRPSAYERLYVNLGGYGIRDLLKVSGGLLIVAGPMGDADQPCELYFWDGSDCVPGRDRTPAELRKLGTIPAPKGGKAEAIALLAETAEHWTLLVLYDSVDEGGPRKLKVTR